MIQKLYILLYENTQRNVNFAKLFSNSQSDFTTIYLPSGAIRFKISNDNVSQWQVDTEKTGLSLDQTSQIEYYQGYGTILNTNNIPKGAKIYFKNVNFVIYNMSDF